MKTLHSAIVGCGAIGPAHARAIAAIDGLELVAVCDLIPERAKKLADEYGAQAYGDFARMLERADIDIVHVCVPSGLHAQLGIQAAQAAKHVIVEKPIDVTLEAADALIAACKSAGVVLSCISQQRFLDEIQALKKAVDEGHLGQLNFGASHTKWNRTQEYYDSADWRGTWALDGGGALMNQSIHYVDLLQYIMGPVKQVSAYCATRAHERMEVEDVAIASILFESGALGVIEGNTTVYPGLYTRLDIYGTDGSVVIQDSAIDHWKMRDGAMPDKLDIAGDKAQGGAGSANIQVSMHQRQIADIADAIRTGREPAITGEAARRPLAVILAIYESAQNNGAPVRVK